MANQNVTTSTITVHGRGSLVVNYKVYGNDGEQEDISTWNLSVEVDGVPILEDSASIYIDPNDSKGRLIILIRDQVETLSASPTPFAIIYTYDLVIDEDTTITGLTEVLWDGVISRVGYVGLPDSTVG